MSADLDKFMAGLKRRNPGQPEFHQAVYEVAHTVLPLIEENPIYKEHQILERMTEPDRVVIFRVCWEDDDGNVRVNRGYRVQFNNSIGPYKGGIRFHPSVTLSVLKFLGFEQIFKNSLTGLPMGGGKGGADFNPKGKSDREVMRFCQAFMTELHKHIGPDTDVPAGDIGVGGREVAFMFGQYKRLENEFTGVLTGKGLPFGGSLIRTEATGYGSTYFCQNMLHHHDDDLKGKNVCVSGSGNVAQYTVQKVTEFGGKVLTMSDSGGFIHDPDGIDEEKLAYVIDLKTNKRGRISEYADRYKGATFHEGKRPWGVSCDVAFPSATQNEIELEDAKNLVSNGCKAVSEGANMPSTQEAVDHFLDSGVYFAPAKAANAGGVATSGLEMTQNSMRFMWTREEVDAKLQEIMRGIHAQCVQHGTKDGKVNYVAGANIAGFKKVADAMVAYGVM
jgi:glutamate dehydrogenase (NADP+)